MSIAQEPAGATATDVVKIRYTLYRDCIQIGQYSQAQLWTVQATNCNLVPGNLNQELDNVYLGEGPTVPSYVLQEYPQASSQYLEEWKRQIVGIPVGGLKAFKLTSDQGYGDGDLFFEVTMLKIYDPAVPPSSSTNPSSSSSSSSSAVVLPPQDNTPFFIGSFAVLGIGAIGIFAYLRLKAPSSVETEDLVSTAKVRQDEKLQSLKKALNSSGPTATTGKSTRQKSNKPRRRR